MTARPFLSFAVLLGALILPVMAAPEVKTTDETKITVPAGEPAELLEWIEETNKTPLTGDTFDARVKLGLKVHDAITIAADQVLTEEAKASEEQSVAAITAKIDALVKLGKLGDPSSLARTQAFVASLADDQRPAIAELYKQYDAKYKFADGKIPQLDHDDVDGSINKMAEYLAKFEKLSTREVNAAMSMARHLAGHEGKEKAAEAYKKFADALATRKEEKMAALAPRFEGLARRLTLVGSKMDISGAYLDGTELDWSEYKGKVVLVDFWATWCGPCIGEIPNVLSEYEKYHAKGFEVLAISLDNDSAAVEQFLAERKIPWKTLFGTGDSAAWNHPMATRYGVTGIPTAILIGPDGTVITDAARGAELGKQLKQLLGEP